MLLSVKAMQRLKQRALKRDYDIIIAGGDGTLNEVVNGIEQPNRPKLGIIPMGTVNDFGRALHLPSDIMGALMLLLMITRQKLI